MKLLLDTHLLIWGAGMVEHLPQEAFILIADPQNELFFSAASMWKIAIKSGLKRADFQIDTRLLRRGLLDNGYNELPIASKHTVVLESLPPLHKDPFDRILICQAMVEGITLLTSDPLVAMYPGPVKRV